MEVGLDGIWIGIFVNSDCVDKVLSDAEGFLGVYSGNIVLGGC